jgi:exonuclease III
MIKKHQLVDIIFAVLFMLIYALYSEIFSISKLSTMLVHTPPQLIFIPIFVLGIYRYLRKENYIVLLSVGLPLFVITFFVLGNYAAVSPGTESKATINSSPVRICSWNTAYFFQWNRDVAYNIIKEKNCTVIVFQEVWIPESHIPEIDRLQRDFLPHLEYTMNEEFIIFYPRNAAFNFIQSSAKGYFGISLALNGKKLSIYNIHLWNPLVPRPFVENDQLRYKSAESVRNAQIIELVEETLKFKNDDSVVILGDFNTMQNAKFLREMNNSSVALVGSPLLKSKNTYPARLPLLQIDHVFVSDSLRKNATKSMLCNYQASDHCLIVLDLLL